MSAAEVYDAARALLTAWEEAQKGHLFVSADSAVVRSVDQLRQALHDSAVESAAAVVAPAPGAVRRSDPDTSHAAARSLTLRSGTQRHRVLAALAACGGYGANDYELGRKVGILRTAAGTRRKELERMGLVKATDGTRPTDTGSAAIVYVPTTEGREALRELDATARRDAS